MAYADIFATEARGMFSPPNGNEPQMIPDYWRETPESEPRTDLPDLSDAELNALGWKGPIENPTFDPYSHEVIWNRETREWNIIELDLEQKKIRVDYQKFWNQLIASGAYNTIKTLAKQSLEVNTIVTEFIAFLNDAKNNNANTTKIQDIIFEIIKNIPFTQEELTEIQNAFTESGLYSIYTLEPPTV